MARRLQTVDELREIAARLKIAGKTLDSVASYLEGEGCKGVEIHSDTVTGRYLPAVEEWILVTQADAKIQSARQKR